MSNNFIDDFFASPANCLLRHTLIYLHFIIRIQHMYVDHLQLIKIINVDKLPNRGAAICEIDQMLDGDRQFENHSLDLPPIIFIYATQVKGICHHEFVATSQHTHTHKWLHSHTHTHTENMTPIDSSIRRKFPQLCYWYSRKRLTILPQR